MRQYKQRALKIYTWKHVRTKPHCVLSDNFLKELVSVYFQTTE